MKGNVPPTGATARGPSSVVTHTSEELFGQCQYFSSPEQVGVTGAAMDDLCTFTAQSLGWQVFPGMPWGKWLPPGDYKPPRQEHMQLGSRCPSAAAEGRAGKKLGEGVKVTG